MFPEKTPLGLEHDVFSSLLDKKACIMVFETRAPFIDIGIPETVSMAGDFIREHIEFFEGGLR
ncbi:MAG: hypothetical protein HY880_06825 [Deltaproteobacteria bacterium]|nr:hypothetical protein [Deltaproteobacteria bacterium]